ncbi:MarR family winged helix-turn-helix transcriptional regulator [Actinomadura rupiterrae]|uniref:MarR family winged helix-turn-helix transcriptional regulator n=1 Tax=Actinomadura rupiterrae TaxID=559627 RepID=UPI0020A419A3|nr:MarR family transcriptional regulator [Actinomadura rupiterrae]MCP2340081.1 DNA-binding MarR family transcriptional regulator [Actinomadura rupiterrae]
MTRKDPGSRADGGERPEPGREGGERPELGELFLRAAKRVHRGMSGRLAPLGLTPAQGRALRVIGKGGEPPRMSELAERLGIVPRSATTLVDALEEAGLIRREADPSNRRATRVVLTEDGRRTLVRMRETRIRAAEEMFAPLSPEQRETLRDLLAAIDPD